MLPLLILLFINRNPISGSLRLTWRYYFRSELGVVALAMVLDTMGNAERGLALLADAEASGVEPSWRAYFTRSRLVARTLSANRFPLSLQTNALSVSSLRHCSTTRKTRVQHRTW